MLKLPALMTAVMAPGLLFAPAADADEFSVCPSGTTGVATADTSCAFAENVRTARLNQPGPVVTAYSPPAQQSYTMQCALTVTDTWPTTERCVGVNSYGVGLIVFIQIPSGGSDSLGQTTFAPEQPIGVTPSPGADTDSPDLPNVNAPGIGCTWVDGYTRSNGTRVSGYLRC